MTIKRVTEKQKEAFNKATTHPLQSWEWGQFREKTGNKIIRLARYKNNKLVDAVQVVFSHIPHANFNIATVIRGPKPGKEMIEELKDLGKEERAIFIKLEPNFVTAIGDQKKAKKDTKRALKLLRKSGAGPGRTLFTPTSFWIDLTRPEKELLKSFHSKTRYNIRLAQRKGVEVVEDNSKKAFEKYIELTRETVERQGFYAHSAHYHKLMWECLHTRLVKQGENPIARLLVAKYKGDIITTWIVFAWHDFLYYPYGASSDKYRNVMANNLIMWEAIKYGKKLGLKTFDLWGREPGKGFTKFKEGYNPSVVEFLGTWDLITSPLYWIYRPAEYIRWATLRVKSKVFPPTF